MFCQIYKDIDNVVHVFYPADRERLFVSQHIYKLSADPVRMPATNVPVVFLDEEDQPESCLLYTSPSPRDS